MLVMLELMMMSSVMWGLRVMGMVSRGHSLHFTSRLKIVISQSFLVVLISR